jgi:hypothetical protein
VNDVGDFEVLATRDQGLFHAGLAIASVYYNTGTSNLYHCQQTLQVVSGRLSDYYLQTSDETIGAVGLLVIHDASLHAIQQDVILLIMRLLINTDAYRFCGAFCIAYEWFGEDD